MANTPTYSDPIDRLSNLPDALLITILSFLPTHIAARTSVLSRRFRHLWEASPSLDLISGVLTKPRSDNFLAMVNRALALLKRNSSHALLSLSLEVSRCDQNDDQNDSFISSLRAKLEILPSLDLRHLTIDFLWLYPLVPVLPIIFTIKSLRCLSLDGLPAHVNFPSKITLTCLRSLSLRLYRSDSAKLNQLLSKLCSLEDLHLHISGTPGLSLSSHTIRKLELIIGIDLEKHDNVGLSFPKLVSLHLEIKEIFRSLSHIHGEFPLLRKAVINLHNLHERNVSTVAGLLNCISHVEDLCLHLKESEDEKHPFPILLESGKGVRQFLKLEHLDLTLCFHEYNLEAVTTVLHNCPALKSLKLVHEVPKFSGSARGRKRKDWGSKLPRNAGGNYRDAYFRNLHLEENRKEVIKLLSKKCSSKRQA